MPDIKTQTEFEKTNLFRTKTIYRTGAGRLQWGEGIISPQNSIKEKKSRSLKKSRSFRINASLVNANE